MPAFQSKINVSGETFRRNRAQMLALIEQLRALEARAQTKSAEAKPLFDRRGQLSKKELRQLLDKGYLASDAPPHMLELTGTVGATYYFRVRGETEGPLWGTDVYTGDSSLSVAAVHAGAQPHQAQAGAAARPARLQHLHRRPQLVARVHRRGPHELLAAG